MHLKYPALPYFRLILCACNVKKKKKLNWCKMLIKKCRNCASHRGWTQMIAERINERVNPLLIIAYQHAIKMLKTDGCKNR